MKNKLFILTFILITVAQAVRIYLVPMLSVEQKYYAYDIIVLFYHENPDGFGGMGESWGWLSRLLIINLLPIGLTLLTGFLAFFKTYEMKLFNFGYCLAFAGGISNVFEKLSNGYVVDYVLWNFRFYYTDVMNIADLYIYLAILVLSICTWKDYESDIRVPNETPI